jgi:Cu/Ag efflux protein CusF
MSGAKNGILPAILLPPILLATSCGSNPEPKQPPKRFQMHGQVVRLDPQAKVATISAQKIEGWMDAMSMEYPVKDPQDFSTLHPDDCIDATVWVQGADYWVGEVKHSAAAPGACLAPPPDSKKTP